MIPEAFAIVALFTLAFGVPERTAAAGGGGDRGGPRLLDQRLSGGRRRARLHAADGKLAPR